MISLFNRIDFRVASLFLLVSLLLSWSCSPLYSQRIVALETKWNDSFKEWTIFTETDSLEGSLEGSLEMTWKLDDDWTEWRFELGDFYGIAKQSLNDVNYWEFRAGNETMSARTIWSNDFSEWRCTDGTHIIKLKSRFRDAPLIWFSEGENYGYIDIFMEYEDDPTWWLIEDHLQPDISPLYRMGLIFLAIFHSTPKF